MKKTKLDDGFYNYLVENTELVGEPGIPICYAVNVEDDAIEQIRRMCDYPLTEGSRICIMPDVHSGKGCTIGTTMTVTDNVCPNIVGVDIGCGRATKQTVDTKINIQIP